MVYSQIDLDYIFDQKNFQSFNFQFSALHNAIIIKRCEMKWSENTYKILSYGEFGDMNVGTSLEKANKIVLTKL